jgi:5-methylcytosine-specific restriction endonuclease McrA
MADQSTPWRTWYQLERWRKIRRHQLRTEPLCRMCLAVGMVTPATIADHIDEHSGDWNAFWLSDLQSLCTNCHSSRKRLVTERGYDPTIGTDGWPIDPMHPSYTGRIDPLPDDKHQARRP